MEAVCGHCEESVSIVPAGGDDWKWVGADGSSVGTNYPDGFDSPTFWKDLAERDPESYSLLSAMDQLCMTGWMHQHYPKPGSRPAFAGVVEECCGIPMHLAPRGWVCRSECGAVIEIGSGHEARAAA